MAIDQHTFPQVPYAWYYACRSADGVDRPIKLSLGGREYVLFRTADGKWAALAARCVHMGADLSGGRLRSDRIVCPFHEWQFDRSGACVHIPATEDIPPFARQATFPVAEAGGHVFVFNRPRVLVVSAGTSASGAAVFDDAPRDDLDEIREIRWSSDVRQGEPMPQEYLKGIVKPCQDPPSRNRRHDYVYFGVFQDEKLLGYVG